MEPFLIAESRLIELAATRQGRVSLAGFNFQAAYAVARLASMLIRQPILELPDFPLRLRYDWGEDLDEYCENERVVFTQCKRIATIGQPAGLASVLQSFAAKWLSVPAARHANVHFRLVCTDQRFRAGGQLADVASDARTDTAKHFEAALGTKPSDRSDRALWQGEANAIGHMQLFASLWERTDVLFLSPNVITGHPAGPLLCAEREALESLLTFSQIQTTKQAEALDRLRRIVHDNLISFEPANEAEAGFPSQTPRIRERADVANALAVCELSTSATLPFNVVDRTFLSRQRDAPRRQFVARQPDWADVAHGADETIKFVERSITAEMRGKIIAEIVEPLERGTDDRLHMLFVVGAPGAGKTTLVRRIAAMLVDEGRVVVADAGLDVLEPAGSPDEYAEPLGHLASAGRPVIFLLDDPLFGNSPWIPILKRLNRPPLRIAVLAPCPQMLFDRHRGRIPFGVVKHVSIGSPTEAERSEMRRLYGRATNDLMSADEFLVVAMEAAAGIPFDEIMRRLWQTLNDGNSIYTGWDAAAWTIRAFMVVAFFHRAYAGCPEPILRAVLTSVPSYQLTGNLSEELARLHSRDGWLMFKFRGHERAIWGYQGALIQTAHQRIAQRAWELRPLDWVNVGSKIVEVSLFVPQCARQLGMLAAWFLTSDSEADKGFAARLIDTWSREEHQAKLETRYLCDLISALQVNGLRQTAVRFKPILIPRAQPLNDGWVAALSLCFLSGDALAEQNFPKELDLALIISHADFSIAPTRAGRFFNRLSDQTKPIFTKRLLDAFDGVLPWRLGSTLIAWLIGKARREMLKRSAQLMAWLHTHPDDTTVRNGYLGLLSRQVLGEQQLDEIITDTEAWLQTHPDDTNVRNGYLGLLSRQVLGEQQLDGIITDTEAWLHAHPFDSNVRSGYMGLLASIPQHLIATFRDKATRVSAHTRDWLAKNPNQQTVRTTLCSLLLHFEKELADQCIEVSDELDLICKNPNTSAKACAIYKSLSAKLRGY